MCAGFSISLKRPLNSISVARISSDVDTIAATLPLIEGTSFLSQSSSLRMTRFILTKSADMIISADLLILEVSSLIMALTSVFFSYNYSWSLLNYFISPWESSPSICFLEASSLLRVFDSISMSSIGFKSGTFLPYSSLFITSKYIISTVLSAAL